MKHAKNESDSSRMLPKDHHVASPSTDEGSSGGSLPGGGGGGGSGSGLKKGPWTSAEDAILVDYVQKHGEGNWNAVQKHSGLSRCGKSCRLRWANHLRPNLKKGAFTQEEEKLIIELHARMGNKWARMAASLPGRTDNEIKNYWNTRIKRRQRAGLPIYPASLSFAESNENQQQDQNIGDFATGDKMQIEAGMQGNGYDIPNIQFDNYNVTNAGTLTYSPAIPAYSTNMLCQGGFESSQTHGFVMNPPPLDCKRLRLSETLYPVYPGSELSAFDNPIPYDPDPISMNLAPYDGGSHALINGNFSTSRTLQGTVKSELPSLQYTTTTDTTDPSCWLAYPSSPPPEAVETYIQSPPTVSVQSECSSPRNSNSGLLEEVLHESQALHSGKSKQLLSDKCSNSNSSLAMTPSDMMDNNSSENNFCDVDTTWEDCDPISPLGGSASSIFNEYTPPVSGSSMDELPPPSRVPSVSDIKLQNLVEGEEDIKPRAEFLRPDALLGCPSWFSESSSRKAKDHTDMNNAIATLLADEGSKEQKPVVSSGTGATPTSTKTPRDDSYSFDNIND